MELWREELYHHGIKGQKWGVRRFQNDDGSLTSRGRKRYESLSDRAHEMGRKAKARHDARDRSKAKKAANAAALGVGLGVASLATFRIAQKAFLNTMARGNYNAGVSIAKIGSGSAKALKYGAGAALVASGVIYAKSLGLDKDGRR